MSLGSAAYPFETGGVLLGRWHSHTAVVEVVVGAGPNATHGATWFEPDQGWQEAAIAGAWRDRDGQLEYLGDWHTHPNGSPKPSRRDLDVLRLIAGHEIARCREPVMLVVGIRGSGTVEAAAIRWTGNRARTLRLQLAADHSDHD